MIARLRLELKSQRLLYAVPVVVIWILVPLVVYSNYLASDGDLFITRLFAINSAQQFIPLFAVWWPVFVMKEYLNAPGNELLYVYRFGWDTLLSRMLALWIWYGLHWSVICGVMALFMQRLLVLYLLVWAQCFFLIAVAYGVAMVSRNTFLPLIVTVLYCLGCILFQLPVSIFSLEAPLEAGVELWPAAVMLASGGVFLAAGYSLEKRLLKDG